MLEVAKKPHTKIVEIRIGSGSARLFRVPQKKAKSLAALLEDYEVEQTVNAKEVLPVLGDPERRPGAMLRGARLRDGLTQVKLAGLLKTSQSAIAAMETGTRPIGKTMASRLAKLFKTDPRLFL